MRIGDLLWLPVRVLWAAIKAGFIPAAITLIAWWLLPDEWAKWITIVMAVWAAIVFLLIATRVSGHVRSMSRGPVNFRLEQDWP
jgi:riboflavin transporter FmnP